MKRNSKKFIAFCVMALTCSTAVISQTTLPTIISTDYTCSAGTTYLIDGKVFVTGGATLFIDPGVTLKAVFKGPAIDKSALIITRNGKIEAGGEITAPIIFTSNGNPAAGGAIKSGDWGGVVILGEAPNNRTTNPLIEGIDATSVPAPLTVADVQYGPIPAAVGGLPAPGNPADNSGFMTYCRIEWAGAILGVANELNGLTCGSVGNGTNLEFIEVSNAFDDSFEFFGGTVNAKNLVSFAPDDDAFDFDFGYTGNLQFLVSVLNPNKPTYSSDPSGIESDNDGAGTTATPLTRPRISNLTMIGLQDSVTAGINTGKRLLNAARFRRNSSFLVSNSIFMGYNTGVSFENAQSIADGPLNFNNNYIHAFRALSSGAAPNASNTPTLLGLSDAIAAFDANYIINLVDPFNDSGAPDFRPGSGSPALTGASFVGTFLTAPPAAPVGFFQTVSYRGAFAANVNWMGRWTRFPDFN
jgi:hypothetical protein